MIPFLKQILLISSLLCPAVNAQETELAPQEKTQTFLAQKQSDKQVLQLINKAAMPGWQKNWRRKIAEAKRSIGQTPTTRSTRTVSTRRISGEHLQYLTTAIQDTRDDLSDQIDEVGDSIDDCCEEVLETLTDCCDDLSTKLDEINRNLDECCDDLSDQISEISFSEQTIIETLTECCDDLSNQIQEVNRNLDECCDDLSEQIDDLSGQLDECCTDIIETLTECCDDLSEQIQDVKALVEECCDDLADQMAGMDYASDEILETLTECCDDLSNQIQEVNRNLDECCDDLSEQIDDLSGQLDECCEDILETLTECCETLCEKIEQIEIDIQVCTTGIPSLPFTINDSGNFLLLNTVEVGGGNAITINVDNVCLDLCCNTIIGTGANNGIVINAAKNVTIKNGTIDNMDVDGIRATEVTNLHVEDITVSRSTNGFHLIDTRDAIIEHCVATCNSNHGFLLEGECQDTFTTDENGCVICNPSNSRHNSVIDSQALSTRSEGANAGDVYGFRSIYGFNNVFKNCMASDTHTDSLSGRAAGFSLENKECVFIDGQQLEETGICQECDSKIIDCQVCNTTALTSDAEDDFPLGRPVGIQLVPGFDPCKCEQTCCQELDKNCDGDTAIIGAVLSQLSPNGCFVATAEFSNLGGRLRIFSLDKSCGDCEQVCCQELNKNCDVIPQNITDARPQQLEWSPDGCFVATSEINGSPTEARIRIFKVNKTTGDCIEVCCKELDQNCDEIPQNITNVLPRQLAWSPDSSFVATSEQNGQFGSFEARVRIFKVNKITGDCEQVCCKELNKNCDVIPQNITNVRPQQLEWSPDGCFVATSEINGSPTEARIRIFKVNKTTGDCIEVCCQELDENCDEIPQNITNVVPRQLEWSPDGCFVATSETSEDATTGVEGARLRIFKVNKATGQCDEICCEEFNKKCNGTADITEVVPRQLEWSPDSRFVATSETSEDATTGVEGARIRIFKVNKTTDQCVQVCCEELEKDCSGGDITDVRPEQLAWSPDGCFVATSERNFIEEPQERFAARLRIFKVNKATGQCEEMCCKEFNKNCDGNDITDVGPTRLEWSPDGCFVATSEESGGEVDDGARIRIFKVDKTTGNCEQVCCQELDKDCNDNEINSVVPEQLEWSPDGCFVATSEESSKGARIRIFEIGQVYPKNCEIKNNQVNNTSGGCEGVGILGDCFGDCPPCGDCACNNLIIRNISSYNDVAYRGVSPVFAGGVKGDPTNIDNLAFPPTCVPEDCDECTNEVICCKLDIICDKIEDGQCNTPITELPFTINQPGNFFLQKTLTSTTTNAIIITVDNVCLDLCCNTIIGTGAECGILVQADAGIKNVTIKNGTIDNMSSEGIFAQNVTNLQITEVTSSRCKNGFNLNACQDAVIDECVATCCTAHGFLLQGGNDPVIRAPFEKCEGCSNNKHNCVQNCKALSTISVDDDVYGFRSIGGLNNTFINCIAKDTRTNDTENASVAAGFSLGVADDNGTLCGDCGSKIIDCEVCDSTAAEEADREVAGAGRPVGILFESQSQFTGPDDAIPLLKAETFGIFVQTVAWSPDGCLFGAGTNLTANDANLRTWKVDKATGCLAVADTQTQNDAQVNEIDFSPDGCLLASGANDGSIFVWKVDRATGKLTFADSKMQGTSVNTVAFSPDGCFLATGASGDPELTIWEVDKASGILTLRATREISPVSILAWSPDGCYLAVGASDDILVFEFDKNMADPLGPFTTQSAGGTVSALAFSPDSCFLASGIFNDQGNNLIVYKFDKQNGTLHNPQGAVHGTLVQSVTWSPDGCFLASGAGSQLRIWQFNKADGMLSQLAIQNQPIAVVISVAFSPDGCFLGSGGGAPGLIHISFPGIVTPQECTVKRNQISRSFGGCGGFGIIGLCSGNVEGEEPNITYTGHPNLIINNQVFNADYAYTGVPNVYAKGYCGTPCPFDNVQFPPMCTLDQCDPVIDAINDCCTLLCGKIEDIEDISCVSTPIKDLPCTITESGNYFLQKTLTSNDTNAITIIVDNVCLDLCCNTIIGDDQTPDQVGVFVNGGDGGIKNVTIKNGTIDNMLSGDEGSGIFAQNVTNLQVKEVTASRCKNGFNLDVCQDAIIDECVATCCTFHGFLLQGGNDPVIRAPFDKCEGCSNNKHNCVQNCKALSTISSLNDVYGFRSIGGLNNTFIGCVAKDTRTNDTENAFVAAGFSLGVADDNGTFCADCGSKIIDCEVCDSTAANLESPNQANGRPVGILFESEFDADELKQLVEKSVDAVVTSVAWSPDGCFLAAGLAVDAAGDEIRTYRVDKETGSVTDTMGGINTGIIVNSVAWSPDGCFLAAGLAVDAAGDEIRTYRVDKATGVLTDTMGGAETGALVFSVAWSPDGCFLAAGLDTNAGDEIRTYRVDKATGALTDTMGGAGTGFDVNSVAWSPDGCFLAAGLEENGGDEIRIYRVDKATGALLTPAVGGIDTGAIVFSVAWSPDACYLAAGLFSVMQGETILRTFRVDKATGMLTAAGGDVTVGVGPPNRVFSVAWSPDGCFLAAGLDENAGTEIRTYQVNKASGALTDTMGGVETGFNVRSVAWSPDGCFIAAGGDDASNTGNVRNLSSGLVTPQECTVKRNQISRSFGGCGGFGIIGLCSGNVEGEEPNITYTGHPNLIISNQVFNADYAYTGVPNVYAKGFCGTPCPFDNVQFPPMCTQGECDPVIDKLNAIIACLITQGCTFP